MVEDIKAWREQVLRLAQRHGVTAVPVFGSMARGDAGPEGVRGRVGFMASHLIQDSVVRNLQTRAESSQRLSESLKMSQPAVDWKGLAGFRNVLVHDYLGLDLELVYRAVERDVPRLREACEALLASLGKRE